MKKIFIILLFPLFAGAQRPIVNGWKHAAPVTGCVGTRLYSTGYESIPELDPGGHGQLGAGGLSTTIKHSGASSFHSVPMSVSGGYRSEVQYENTGGACACGQTPVEGVLDYWVYYETVVPNNCHSLQWHPETNGGSASPALWHQDGVFIWKNWKAGTNTDHTFADPTITTNTWLHFRIEYKFGTSGYVRHYINNVLRCSWTGQVGDGSGQYLKIGFNYFSAGAPASSIYYDDVTICSTP